MSEFLKPVNSAGLFYTLTFVLVAFFNSASVLFDFFMN